jgi:hypothetical protein
MSGVSRCGEEEEEGGFVGVFAFEDDLLYAFAGIEAIQLVQLVRDIIDKDPTLSADIDDTEFTALEEEIGAEFGMGAEGQLFFYGTGAAEDHAVVMGIDQADVIRLHQAFREKGGP